MRGSKPQQPPISSRWCGHSRILRPQGMHDFDLLTFFYAYHDITYLGSNRGKTNKAFYDALKPGGELVVGDYSAMPGAGTNVVQTLHRSDEALVTSEIVAAGFKLIDHGDFLHVPEDIRDPPRIPRLNRSISTC
jgi:predicted methyltransferase